MRGEEKRDNIRMKRTHHNLEVWREAIKLVKAVYQLTTKFPQHETYALTSQMRRAAISIPSNIAEGAARSGDKEFLQFLFIARGSLSELETQIIISQELGYIQEDRNFLETIEKIFALLGGLIKSVQHKTDK